MSNTIKYGVNEIIRVILFYFHPNLTVVDEINSCNNHDSFVVDTNFCGKKGEAKLLGGPCEAKQSKSSI